MITRFARLLALSGLLIAGSAAADGFALGVKAGTLGAGVEGTFGLSPRFNVRLGANSYAFTYDEVESDIHYQGDLDLQSAALLLDWHPFAGVFRFTVGAMNNKNAIRVQAEPTGGTYNIGGQDFNSSDVGTLHADMTLGKKNVGYAGFGWGNAARGKGLGLSLEIGAMFQGEPDVTLRREGGTTDPTLSGEIETRMRQEEQEAEAELKDFKIWPVVSLGLSFNF